MSRSRFPARLPDGGPNTGAKPASAGAQFSGSRYMQQRSQACASAPRPQGVGIDSSTVRARMVSQLEAGGITDRAVLAAMNTIERHRFVDTALAPQAYEDTSLPIGFGQTISKPNVVARMIALLREGCKQDHHGRLGRVLEIGSGCGYQACVLAMLCHEVHSIERVQGLYEKAMGNVQHRPAPHLRLFLGDGMLGLPNGAPYAGIIAAAGGEAIPKAWTDQLAIGGRIVAPVGNGARQSLVVIDKTMNGLEKKVFEDVLFVPLKSGTA